MASIFAPKPKPDPPKKEAEVEVGPSKEGLWRQERLREAGYDEVQAALIASDRSVDLHKAVDLAEKAGPELAVRILL